MGEEVYYVNMDSGRIVFDPSTIQPPEVVGDYIVMNEKDFHDYCVEQRRKLDASKEEHRLAEEAFNEQEDQRVENLANQLSTSLGISIEDARTMVPRQVYHHVPDPTVSEKVFGGIVLPEEEEGNDVSN